MDWLAQARELKDRGEIGRAIDLLEQAIASGDESPQIYKETARLCLIVNEIRAFTNYCHEAMRIDPSDPEPHLMIGRVLSDYERWGEALEVLEYALQMPALTSDQRQQAQHLAAAAQESFQVWKASHPGHSNL